MMEENGWLKAKGNFSKDTMRLAAFQKGLDKKCYFY
jgi:hypothetical protein